MTETGQKSHVKELFSHTVFYGIGLFLNKSLSILLLPLYTIYFSTQELGLYAIIFSIWMFVNIIYIYGTETSFLKFFIDTENKKDKSSVYTTTLAMMSVSSLVFSAVIYLLSGSIVRMIGFENPAQAVEMVKILSALLFFDGLMRFPLLLLRAELKAKTYAVLTIISLCTNLALNFILIIYFRMSVDAILYSYIAGSILTLITGLIITRGYIGGGINMKVVKELVKYGNKFIYIGVFLIFIEQSDRFFIKYFYDESMVGIYSANYRLAAVMSLIIASFRFSWTPYFLNIAKNPENKKIIANIFTYFIFGSSLLFLTLSFFIETIVTTQIFTIYLLDPAYWSGLNIIPVLLLSYFFSGVCAYLNVAPFFANKTSFLLLSAFIGFAVNIALNFLLIPQYGIIGAAYSALATYAVQFIFLFAVSQKIYRINYHYKSIIIIALIAAALYTTSTYLSGIITTASLLIISKLGLIIIFALSIQFFKILDLTKTKQLFKKTT